MTTSATNDVAGLLAGLPTGLLIGGSWRDAEASRRFEVQDPATGRALISVADASATDAREALTAAADAQPDWAASAPRDRSEILRTAYESVVSRVDDLALVMTLEMGKALAESRAEVLYAADFLRWFAEEAVRVGGRFTRSPDGGSRILTSRRPVGPCLLITPWNFPLAMAARKLGPALAAGCTSVVKPAAQTPLSTLALAAILLEAGLPAGVLNVVTTSRAGQVVEPLLHDPRLRKVSFTGSTPVGRHLIEQSAQRLLRTSMELGGNAPFLVFEDADLEAAVDGAVAAKMRNVGQACTAANRFLVHRDVAGAFTRALADRLAAMPVGAGTVAGTEVGPLIDQAARDKVGELVDDAVEHGAKILTGGKSIPGEGYFYSPTVLSEVPAQARIMHEEVFGPVAPVSVFDTESEAIAVANATEYGLAAYVYTRDVDRALRLCDALEAGMVGLNRGVISNAAAPFGGMKASGFGREGGTEGIEEYLETQYVAISS